MYTSGQYKTLNVKHYSGCEFKSWPARELQIKYKFRLTLIQYIITFKFIIVHGPLQIYFHRNWIT